MAGQRKSIFPAKSCNCPAGKWRSVSATVHRPGAWKVTGRISTRCSTRRRCWCSRKPKWTATPSSVAARRHDRAVARIYHASCSRSDDPRERLWGLHGLATQRAQRTTPRASRIYRRALKADAKLPARRSGTCRYLCAARRAGRRSHIVSIIKSAVAYMAGQFDYTPSHSKQLRLGVHDLPWRNIRAICLRAAQLISEAVGYQGRRREHGDSRPFDAASAWAKAHDFSAAQDELAAAGYLDPADARPSWRRCSASRNSVRLMLATATDDHATRAAESVSLIDHFMRAAGGGGRQEGARRSNIYSGRILIGRTRRSRWREPGRLDEASRDHRAFARDPRRCLSRPRLHRRTWPRPRGAIDCLPRPSTRTPSLRRRTISLWAEAPVRTGAMSPPTPTLRRRRRSGQRRRTITCGGAASYSRSVAPRTPPRSSRWRQTMHRPGAAPVLSGPKPFGWSATATRRRPN